MINKNTAIIPIANIDKYFFLVYITYSKFATRYESPMYGIYVYLSATGEIPNGIIPLDGKTVIKNKNNPKNIFLLNFKVNIEKYIQI